MEKLGRLFEAGRWDELLALADDILVWERTVGKTQITTAALVQSAGVLLLRGSLGEARSHIDAALTPAREVHDAQVLAPALVCAALIHQADGNEKGAIELLEEFETATSDRSPIYRALWIADVARLCAATGATALAKRLLSGLDVVVPRHVYGVTTARAVLAEAEDRPDDAVAGYSEVAERWREFGNAVEEGSLASGLVGASGSASGPGRPPRRSPRRGRSSKRSRPARSSPRSTCSSRKRPPPRVDNSESGSVTSLALDPDEAELQLRASAADVGGLLHLWRSSHVAGRRHACSLRTDRAAHVRRRAGARCWKTPIAAVQPRGRAWPLQRQAGHHQTPVTDNCFQRIAAS